jgi:hypothetical protein
MLEARFRRNHDLSAAVAGREAVQRLLEPQEVANAGWVLLAGVVGFIGNELVAVYRIRETEAKRCCRELGGRSSTGRSRHAGRRRPSSR